MLPLCKQVVETRASSHQLSDELCDDATASGRSPPFAESIAGVASALSVEVIGRITPAVDQAPRGVLAATATPPVWGS
jgi:hypothetical protein